MDEASLKDKVVLITGGTSGIGKALALAFGKEGAKIVFNGRDFEKILQTEKELKGLHIEALGVVADVSSETDTILLIHTAYKTFGKIDIIICNAGISMRAAFAEVSLEVLHKVMDINFWGTVHTLKHALPYIIQSKGSIVAISSIAGYRGLPERTGYCASKFALQGFMESLRTELLCKGVHVLVASPGFTASNIRNNALNAYGQPQKESPMDESKIMTAEEVAEKIKYAVKTKKRDLVLTTQGRVTIFLNKWFPGWMDKMVLRHFEKENRRNRKITVN